MSALTNIEWTDRTWNPVRGCSLVSAGCQHCYAMRQAHRFSGPGQPYMGLTKMTAHGPVWTGTTSDGQPIPDSCAGWTSPTGTGRSGDSSSTTKWSDDVPLGCQTLARFYCVED